MSESTAAAAPDCVECPEVYAGNAGVPINGSQVASMLFRMYVTGRCRLYTYFACQQQMNASWTAVPTRAYDSAASASERRSFRASWLTIAIQCPAGVPV